MTKPQLLCLFVLLFLKTTLMVLFSSGYEQDLFIPFVSQFLSTLSNPWNQYLLNNFSKDAFPYHPMMLYIYSLSYSPYFYLFGGSGPLASFGLLGNVFFKMPTLLADCLIFYILLKMFPSKVWSILVYYFANPIIIYASYMHSQLDLVPTAFLVVAIYLLTRKRIIVSGLAFGLATICKLHVLGAVPFCLIFIVRRYRIREVIYFVCAILAIYISATFPYLFTPGFYEMVLANPKQMTLFDSYYQIADIKIYTILVATTCLWGRFGLYGKINIDLLVSYLVIYFSIFVMLIKPGPGWYVWAVPFLTMFFVKQSDSSKSTPYIYAALCVTYLIYFLFFNQFDYLSLKFLGQPLLTQFEFPVLRNISFSILQSVMLGIVYLVYKEGVRSNSIYKKVSSFVVGIGGDSGAGKTTLLNQVRMVLGSSLVHLSSTLAIEGDADHKWERGHENWKKFSHLDPKANYLHSQSDDLMALKHGHAVIRREYDHGTGQFTEPFEVKPQSYIVLCGLHPFYLPKMRKLIDLKIFLDTDERLRLFWKIGRDSIERGYSISKVVQQCESRQVDGQRFIAPQKEFADIVLKYFPKHDFNPRDTDASPQVCLRITLDAGIRMDEFVEFLRHSQVPVNWDYSDDLKTQWLELTTPVEISSIIKIAEKLVPNIDEVSNAPSRWDKDYGAIVQLVILMALAEKKKSRDAEE